MKATGFVGDNVVTEAELVAQVRKKPSVMAAEKETAESEAS
jgi:hypothetical protein